MYVRKILWKYQLFIIKIIILYIYDAFIIILTIFYNLNHIYYSNFFPKFMYNRKRILQRILILIYKKLKSMPTLTVHDKGSIITCFVWLGYSIPLYMYEHFYTLHEVVV